MMIYQQYTTAIKMAYANHPDLAQQVETAESCRRWLQSLVLDPHLRTALVEPIQAIEEAFKDLAQQQV